MDKNIVIVDRRTFSGKLVVLKHNGNQFNAKAGRSWFAVIDGKTHFPRKSDAVIHEQAARAWVNQLCRELGLLKK